MLCACKAWHAGNSDTACSCPCSMKPDLGEMPPHSIPLCRATLVRHRGCACRLVRRQMEERGLPCAHSATLAWPATVGRKEAEKQERVRGKGRGRETQIAIYMETLAIAFSASLGNRALERVLFQKIDLRSQAPKIDYFVGYYFKMSISTINFPRWAKVSASVKKMPASINPTH